MSHMIHHVAGQYADGVQRCMFCGELLVARPALPYVAQSHLWRWSRDGMLYSKALHNITLNDCSPRVPCAPGVRIAYASDVLRKMFPPPRVSYWERIRPYLPLRVADWVRSAIALAIACGITALASCSSTRPLNAYKLLDGTRVGVSKQVVFFKAYDMNEAIHVAQDNAGILVVDSSDVKRRVRAFGSAYITTVAGK